VGPEVFLASRPRTRQAPPPPAVMASVFIGDLDDFITPSQACVNPIFAGTANQQPEQTAQEGDGDKGRAKVTLEASWMEEGAGAAAVGLAMEVAPAPVRPDLIKVKTGQAQGTPAAATVSLNDCLACR
jgi:hypothetical protein